MKNARPRKCSTEGCTRMVYAKDACKLHYYRRKINLRRMRDKMRAASA